MTHGQRGGHGQQYHPGDEEDRSLSDEKRVGHIAESTAMRDGRNEWLRRRKGGLFRTREAAMGRLFTVAETIA